MPSSPATPADPTPRAPTPRAPTPSGTTPSGTARLALLDVLRGVAILGTFGTNVWVFTDPAGAIGVLGWIGPATGDALASSAETLFRFLANGKFLALLTLMFGVGLEIQYRSAVRRGRRWPGWYLWRSALLLVEGLLHYVLIFEFDVLMGYAVVAIVVSFLVGRSTRVLVGWLLAAGVVHLAVVALATIGLALAGPTGPAPTTDLYTDGSWLDQVAFRLENLVLLRAEAVFIGPLGVLLFGVGILLFRAGAFGLDEGGRRWRRRLAAWGLGLGVPANLATTVATTYGGLEALFVVDRYLAAPLVALGYLGLVGLLVDRFGTSGQLGVGLTAVGRTALSCYVGQNLLASVLCYGWGLGLAVALVGYQPWATFALWAAVSLALVAGARLWLRRFSRGPLEAAWHWAYEAPQRGVTQRNGSQHGGSGTAAAGRP